MYVTNAVAQSRLGAFRTAANAGTAAILEIYSGSVPADADASHSGGTKLATLTCAADLFSGIADGAPGAVGTFDTITPDASADNSGTATYAVLLTQSGGTKVALFTVGTSGTDIVFPSNVFSAGAEIGIASFTITDPEG